jgi:hypothetical protein
MYKPASWISYSLDGQDNVTITGNTTLVELAIGLHNVSVYAKDELENSGVSETIYFTVAREPEPEPFSAVWVATALAIVAAAGIVSLSAYYVRHKRATNTAQ